MKTNPKTKKKKSGLPKFSAINKPEDLTMEQWQAALRSQAADDPQIRVVPEDLSTGLFRVVNNKKHSSYKVVYRGIGSKWNYCSCMDFRTNRLGTCKHVEAARVFVQEMPQRFHPVEPSYSSLYVDYRGPRRVRMRIGSEKREEFKRLAERWLDENGDFPEYKFRQIEEFVFDARAISPDFRVYDDTLDYIAEVNDMYARRRLAVNFSNNDIDSVVRTTLYPYQREGVRKAFLAGRSIIADEMGLGKTVQAIATAELFRKYGMVENVLVVCPTSLKYQWSKEIEKFTGNSVTVVEGHHLARRKIYEERKSFYSVVSIHSLANDLKTLGEMHFDMVVVDEIQRLKNWDTKLSQNLRRLSSDYTVVLSGTPLENKIEELYSVMEFVDPYCLGPYYTFMQNSVVRSDSGKVVQYKNLNSVSEQIGGRMIRRRKADVALQMPPRTDTILYVPMTEEQAQIHDEAQTTVAQLVLKWNRMHFLSDKDRNRLLLNLSRMRMVCDSTFILDQASRYDNKVEECINLIMNVIAGGDGKVVVFSQWERMTRLIAAELEKRGVEFEYLHGGVPSHKRRTLTENFTENPDSRVFISTDAGSTGLNLQVASTLINVDLPWNPAVLEQRVARIYRIGQQSNIQVINMVAPNSIEERMLGTLRFKTSLFEGVLDGGEDVVTLTDNRLAEIAKTFMESYPEETEKGKPDSENTEISDSSDNYENSDSQNIADSSEGHAGPEAASAASKEPAPSKESEAKALVDQGMDFLSKLGDTLRSPEKVKDLVDTIVKTDEETGQTILSIPVPDKATVSNLLNLFSAFMSK